GVDVFFVISGFVLPLSLWMRWGADYNLANFGSFMRRRLIRIEPPYLISIILMILSWETVAVLRGEAPTFSVCQIAWHIAYLPKIAGFDWIQPVYWTLGFEFCFYVVIGVTFPLF